MGGDPTRITSNTAGGLTLDDARLQLSRLSAGAGKPLREVWLALAKLASVALRVDRVGVWVLTDGGRAIRNLYLLQRSGNHVFQGALLRASDFPSYFKAIQQLRIVCAADAVRSEFTRELLPAYLQPLGITSMLDAPIFLDGELAGVVCHEHIGPMRTWTDAECEFAAAVARAGAAQSRPECARCHAQRGRAQDHRRRCRSAARE